MATDQLTSLSDLGNFFGSLIDQMFEIKSLLAGAGCLCATEHGPVFGEIGRLFQLASEKADALIKGLDSPPAD